MSNSSSTILRRQDCNNESKHIPQAEKEAVRKSKQVRQREIVEAAVRVMGQYGVRGTTVTRIASAAGISGVRCINTSQPRSCAGGSAGLLGGALLGLAERPS
jgi:hypothetical protein